MYNTFFAIMLLAHGACWAAYKADHVVADRAVRVARWATLVYVVFYVLEGSGVWQEEGKEAVTLKPGDSLHVRPGTVHAHRNASSTAKLVFLEFVIVDKGQRSTVPMR